MADAAVAASGAAAGMSATTADSFPAFALRGRVLELANDREWLRYLPPRLQLERARRLQMTLAAKEAFGASPKEADETSTAEAFSAVPTSQHVAGKVWHLSLAAVGCREVQAALDEACTVEREALAAELRGHIFEAISSPHANFVVQRCIELLPTEALQFVIDEIERAGFIWAAKHKYGCRVVQRLLERCPAGQVQKMVDALLTAFLDVGKHAYGTHVLQLLVRTGPASRQKRVRSLVEAHLEALVCHPRGGCGLLAAALEHGEEVARLHLADALRASPHFEHGGAAWLPPHVARLREGMEQVLSGAQLVQPTFSEPEHEHWGGRTSSRRSSLTETEPEQEHQVSRHSSNQSSLTCTEPEQEHQVSRHSSNQSSLTCTEPEQELESDEAE